jgi:Glycosyltransferase family 87
MLGLAEMVPAVRQAVQDQTGDLSRQWAVTQYVIRRVNPYPIALEALVSSYGALAPRGPVHLRDTQIYDVPSFGPHPTADPALGPPEATYPPGSVMMLVPLGFLPRETVARLWLLLNVTLVFLVAWELKALAHTEAANSLFFLGLVAAWPAVSICIEREQFSLLCLYCILGAYRIQSRHPMVAGLLYSLSLVKPSMAIPFLALPLFASETSIADKTRTLASVAVSQLTLLGAICWMVRDNPGDLIAGWLRVAGYFRQGIYTVQEIINRLRLDGSPADFALQIGILLVGIFLAYQAEGPRRPAILAIISCIWTYHARHDFVILLIPAALLAAMPVSRRWIVELAALVVVGIGLTEPVYHGTSRTSKVVRMAARFSVAALLTGAALSWSRARRPIARAID